MAFTTLIDTATLAEHLRDFVVVDCRYNLQSETWGFEEYVKQHIPGAVFASIDHDLSGKKTGTNGRHPLPEVDDLLRTLGRLGIGNSDQVVAYDQGAGMYASRLWWLLRWLGHESAAVLDGGFARWLDETRPTASGTETRSARKFTGRPGPEFSLNAAEVEAVYRDPAWRLVDARAPERYRGETEPVDKVAGHIPGAVNHPYASNVDERGMFLAPGELRSRLLASIGDVPPERVVCYCGSGVTACHDLLALERAGLHGAKLYPGSWSEWCANPERPVETRNNTQK